MNKKNSKRTIVRVRDARTGQFRPDWHADRWPQYTIEDRMKVKKKKD